MRRLHAALALLAAAALALPAPALPQAAPPAEWRGARWGMTLPEVLAAFPGEARKLDPPISLADGNVVAAGIDRHVVAATAFRVRFVFAPAGGLALVSLRTPESAPATPEAMAAVEKALSDRLGPPTARGETNDPIEQRQVTWKGPTGRVDLKYIPGTLVVLHAAPSQVPPAAPPAPR